ncbi:MAG: hypothetical protein ACLVHQ_02110 [Oscillospiraceae bacterium]
MDKIQKYTFVIDEETQSTCGFSAFFAAWGSISKLYTKAHRPGQVSVDGKVCRLKNTRSAWGRP